MGSRSLLHGSGFESDAPRYMRGRGLGMEAFDDEQTEARLGKGKELAFATWERILKILD